MKLEFDANVHVPTIAENDFLNEIDAPRDRIDLNELLSEGIKAAQNGRRSEARSFLLTVTESDPDNETAWLWMASISEYPEELLGFLNNVLRINPKNERALEWRDSTKSLLSKTFVQRGIDASKENRKDFAKQCFRQALVHNERSEMAWLWMAACADSDDEKTGYLQKVLDIDPKHESARASLDALRRYSAEPLLQEAFAAAAEGKNKRASKLLEEVISLDAELENAWMLKFNLAQSVAEKLECLERVLKLNPGNSLASSNLEFLRSMNLKNESNGNHAQNEPVDVSMDLVEDTTPTGDLEFFPQENEATEAFAGSIDLAEAVSFDEAEYHVESESPGEVQELQQVYAYEESGAEEDHSVYETEAVPFYPDLAEEQDEKKEDEMFEENSPEAYEDIVEESESAEIFAEENDREFQLEAFACPFCDSENEAQTFVCGSCRAVYSLSDLEMLLAPGDVNKEIIADALQLTEAELSLRDLDVDELKFLAVGYFNLDDPQKGLSYLKEAAKLDPDDILLASQLNALMIRLSEIEKKQSVNNSTPKNMTILVADDSATVRKLISGKLEKCGHTVVCAVDGVEALEKLEEIAPDLILLDINMPRMDGYQACKLIRGNEMTKDVPIVMISGKDGFFDKVRGRMAGTTGYITKPFGPETLMKTVETYALQPA